MNQVDSAHPEEMHKSHRSGWLRASVLGVNDGIVSTASLMLGVATASSSKTAALTAGIAGLTAGALSMAIGEYVSVSSQKDSEKADIAIERLSLKNNPDAELQELTNIYKSRGLDADLAHKVAVQLHEKDAVSAHVRDELGIDQESLSKPFQAATYSALSFATGAALPIIAAIATNKDFVSWAIIGISLIALAISGAIGAVIGGGHKMRAAARVFIGGGAAMAITALIGHLIGTRI